MEKLIEVILTGVAAFLIMAGGRYTIREVADWSRKVALEKAVKGLDRLEPVSRKLTGSKLDF